MKTETKSNPKCNPSV